MVYEARKQKLFSCQLLIAWMETDCSKHIYMYLFSWSFLSSQDIDECFNKSVSQCAQKCVNTPSSFLCGCNKGYELNANKRDCDGKRLGFVVSWYKFGKKPKPYVYT